MEAVGQSCETLASRVRRTLQDLALIRQSVADMTSHAQGQTSQVPKPALELELAAELKSVVDALRELLWTYVVALSAKSGRRPQEVVDWYHVELAVSAVQSADANLSVEQPKAAAPGTTFQDLVTTALSVTALHTGEHTG